MGSIFSKLVRPKKPPTNFFSLPREIRDKIYGEVVVVGKVFLMDDRPEDQARNSSSRERYADKHLYRKPDLAIFRVCKQIHAEAEKVYLTKNLFVFSVGWMNFPPFKNPSTNPPLFSQRALTTVRNISLALDKSDLTHLQAKGRDAASWGRRYDTMTRSQRREIAHQDLHWNLDMNFEDQDELFDGMRRTAEDPTLVYVELDVKNALCPLGCCRPFQAWLTPWLFTLRPAAIDILGARSVKEGKKIKMYIVEEIEFCNEDDEMEMESVDAGKMDIQVRNRTVSRL